MKKYIDENLARNLRGSLNKHIYHLGNIIEEPERRDKLENPKCESNALIAVRDLNCTVSVNCDQQGATRTGEKLSIACL